MSQSYQKATSPPATPPPYSQGSSHPLSSQDMSLQALLPAWSLHPALCQILCQVGSFVSVPTAATLIWASSISFCIPEKCLEEYHQSNLCVTFSTRRWLDHRQNANSNVPSKDRGTESLRNVASQVCPEPGRQPVCFSVTSCEGEAFLSLPFRSGLNAGSPAPPSSPRLHGAPWANSKAHLPSQASASVKTLCSLHCLTFFLSLEFFHPSCKFTYSHKIIWFLSKICMCLWQESKRVPLFYHVVRAVRTIPPVSFPNPRAKQRLCREVLRSTAERTRMGDKCPGPGSVTVPGHRGGRGQLPMTRWLK